MISSKLALMMTKPPTSLRPQDVFATSLYTGNNSTQTITNGINISGEGGLVWIKARSGTYNNVLYDTVRGPLKELQSNTAGGEVAYQNLTGFSSNGFSVKLWDNSTNGAYTPNGDYVAWTFRRAPKFFDVVTYTGNGTAGRTVNHNLGVAPGMVIIKRRDSASLWSVYHRSTGETQTFFLNTPDPVGTSGIWYNTLPTATTFTVVGNNSGVNGNGFSYVAYLFAHDTDTSGVVQCGSATAATHDSNIVVNLGWKPQFILFRNAVRPDNWLMLDSARGLNTTSNISNCVHANLSGAEFTIGSGVYPMKLTSTGFSFNAGNLIWGAATDPFIYLAIREPV